MAKIRARLVCWGSAELRALMRRNQVLGARKPESHDEPSLLRKADLPTTKIFARSRASRRWDPDCTLVSAARTLVVSIIVGVSNKTDPTVKKPALGLSG